MDYVIRPIQRAGIALPIQRGGGGGGGGGGGAVHLRPIQRTGDGGVAVRVK